MKDYYNDINGEFMNTIQLKDDEPRYGIREFLLKKDHKDILNIITAPTHKYLNDKENRTLKIFNDSIDKYNDDEYNLFLKNIVNDIFKYSNDDMIVFLCRNQIAGLMSMSASLFNHIMYMSVSQSSACISNSSLYQNKEFIIKYKEIIKNMISMYIPITDVQIDKIFEFESLLEKHRLSSSEMRNPNESINIVKINDIKFKNYNITNILHKIIDGVATYKRDDILIDDKDLSYYKVVDDLLNDKDFKYYIVWCTIFNISSYSFGKIYDYKFELVKLTKGVKKQMIFDKKKIYIFNSLLGHIISKEYFSLIEPNTKPRIKKMIEYIVKAFRNRLENNKWMNHETKLKAIEKLDNMKFYIAEGKLVDFNTMEELTTNYLKNIQIIGNYLYNTNLRLLNKYEQLLHGNIYEINAYYDPTKNICIFPYGMLRPPYFYSVELNSDVNMMAYNFGAIGSVIGHEIIHGFDDQGRQFDKNGDLNNWWDDVSGKKYMEMAEEIGKKYKEFNINPKLTMGENIADIGGLRISLSGLILFLKESNIPNLSEKILNYFIKGWAMIWRNKITKQEYDIRILKDPHSPVEQRVNIPLSFIKELKDNEKNKNEIIEIW